MRPVFEACLLIEEYHQDIDVTSVLQQGSDFCSSVKLSTVSGELGSVVSFQIALASSVSGSCARHERATERVLHTLDVKVDGPGALPSTTVSRRRVLHKLTLRSLVNMPASSTKLKTKRSSPSSSSSSMIRLVSNLISKIEMTIRGETNSGQGKLSTCHLEASTLR
jgi:hypothetical protein